MRVWPVYGLVVALSAGAPAVASETITYTYDPLGRVTATSSTGTVNAGLNKAYGYDAADNRSSVTVSGSSWNGATRVVIVPLRGLSVIVVATPNTTN